MERKEARLITGEGWKVDEEEGEQEVGLKDSAEHGHVYSNYCKCQYSKINVNNIKCKILTYRNHLNFMEVVKSPN